MIRPHARFRVIAFILALAGAFCGSATDGSAQTAEVGIDSAEAEDKALVTANSRRALRKLTADIAQIGSWDFLDDYVDVLLQLGDTPADHQDWRPRWTKAI